MDETEESVSDQEVLTTAEAAALLRVCQRTVLRMIWSGSLGAQRVGRQWRIPASVLTDLGFRP
jgi:excisionase family DNA binding protein